jgi:2-keto-4-pentenoate hydratase/2-oxohepta-3-ene-1,7-dioic acid hydratase in catechol pathway
MKLAIVLQNRVKSIAIVRENRVVDVALLLKTLAARRVPAGFRSAAAALKKDLSVPADMTALLDRGDSWLRNLDRAAAAICAAPAKSLPKGLISKQEGARFCAPIARPGKIVCVGRNYSEHAKEGGSAVSEQPILFLKASTCVCDPGSPIVIPRNSTHVDYEAELAVVIGKTGKDIPIEQAEKYIAGYTLMNDVSERQMQKSDGQWFRAKSCDTFGPMGPWIVTRDEISDAGNLRISCTLDSQLMQDSSTSNLIFKIPFLISYLSNSITWETGDILSTGTPAGVGAFRTPPVFLAPGNVVSVTVEKIGTLTNPVRAPQSKSA